MVNITDHCGFSLNVTEQRRQLATLTKLRDAFGGTQALSSHDQSQDPISLTQEEVWQLEVNQNV